jgi:hypothetical protein
MRVKTIVTVPDSANDIFMRIYLKELKKLMDKRKQAGHKVLL